MFWPSWDQITTKFGQGWTKMSLSWAKMPPSLAPFGILFGLVGPKLGKSLAEVGRVDVAGPILRTL
eukprot:5654204-Karenia_brevis.AAC.1